MAGNDKILLDTETAPTVSREANTEGALTTEVTVIHEEGTAKREGQDVLADYEERVEIWSRIAAARRTCRECGGYGRFFWGAQDHGECGACRGTGRV